jgi:hypothetical protein
MSREERFNHLKLLLKIFGISDFGQVATKAKEYEGSIQVLVPQRLEYGLIYSNESRLVV